MTEVATILVTLGILGLFVLEWDPKSKTSFALWLPIVWLSICASRPVSLWFGSGFVSDNAIEEGNPFERNIYICLIFAALAIMVTRHEAVLRLLRSNIPIVVFLGYTLISIVWSDHPGVAAKRWIKFIGDFAMIMIIVTDKDRTRAIRKVFASAGFILIPVSILFIKYYPEFSRYYSRWEGMVFYRGVSADKNMLGMACLIFGLASAWRVLEELHTTRKARTFLAHGTIVLMVLWLLKIADSMTSLACFSIGTGLMVITAFFKFGQKRAFLHLAVPAALILSCLGVFFGGPLLTAIGRDPTLTGRTILWDQVLKLTPNPLLGTGFESFWLGSRLDAIWDANWWHPNQAHNGYIETYLNLGWLGVGALGLVIVGGYRRIIQLMVNDQEAARIRLAFFVIAVIYNYTEAAMKMMHPVWFVFLIAVIGVPPRVSARTPAIIVRRRARKKRPVGKPEPVPAGAAMPVQRLSPSVS